MHGRCDDADADTVVGNWKLCAAWKCTDMHSRLSDWLGRPVSIGRNTHYPFAFPCEIPSVNDNFTGIAGIDPFDHLENSDTLKSHGVTAARGHQGLITT